MNKQSSRFPTAQKMFCLIYRAWYKNAMMKSKVTVCLIALCASLFTSYISHAQDRVRVAISNFSASYISMHIAQKRGYYAEEGMIVEIILMAGLTSTRALIGNSVELGSALYGRQARMERRARA